MTNTFEKMDRMYRFQRYFYDFTRSYYLLGRDRLADEMCVRPGERILEIGCGTARNLIILAKRYPKNEFYGLDASAAMLETGKSKIDAADIGNIRLVKALADDFSNESTFKLSEPFDKIFFSYSISMIPNWQQSIDNALRNLKCGGVLSIVDFYDQHDLPAVLRRSIQRWLRLFHVRYPQELIPYLQQLQISKCGVLTFKPLFRRYAFLAEIRKADISGQT